MSKLIKYASRMRCHVDYRLRVAMMLYGRFIIATNAPLWSIMEEVSIMEEMSITQEAVCMLREKLCGNSVYFLLNFMVNLKFP